MIIRYQTDGEILGYTVIGGSIPDEIPTGEHYLNWNGVTPEPTYNYVVQDNAVVLKSDAEQVSYQKTIKSRGVRGERDKLLAETDWRDLPSYPGVNQEAWRTYRQALRDLPSQAGFPNNITWPAKPT